MYMCFLLMSTLEFRVKMKDLEYLMDVNFQIDIDESTVLAGTAVITAYLCTVHCTGVHSKPV